jgi:hypothetical protein
LPPLNAVEGDTTPGLRLFDARGKTFPVRGVQRPSEGHRNRCGHGPQKAHLRTGNSHHLVGMFTAGPEAPSTSTRRPWVLPAFVMEPYRRRSTLEYSAGIRPENFRPSLGVWQRMRSPSSATIVTAPVRCTPRKA